MTAQPNRTAQAGLLLLIGALGAWITGCALASGTGWGANPLVPWQNWPPFEDLRIILTGMDAARHGLDPMGSEYLYNYPPIWLKLGVFGWGADDAIVLGLAQNLAFLLCVGWIFWPVAASRSGWAWMGLLVCPPLMLALERANNDVIIFMLVCAAGAWPRQKQGLGAAAALVGLAAVLKLYPLAALGAIPGDSGRHLRLASALLVVGFGCYVAGNLPAIRAVITKTPVSGIYSYGASTLVERAAVRFPEFFANRARLDKVSRYALIGGALAAVGAGFFAGRQRSAPAQASGTEDTWSRWFYGGAGIYVATYVLLINWEYRLVFLFLCVPWLHRLAQWAEHRRRAQLSLAGIAAVTWGVAFPLAAPFLITQAAALLLAILLAYECGRQPPALWSAWTRWLKPDRGMTPSLT